MGLVFWISRYSWSRRWVHDFKLLLMRWQNYKTVVLVMTPFPSFASLLCRLFWLVEAKLQEHLWTGHCSVIFCSMLVYTYFRHSASGTVSSRPILWIQLVHICLEIFLSECLDFWAKSKCNSNSGVSDPQSLIQASYLVIIWWDTEYFIPWSVTLMFIFHVVHCFNNWARKWPP